MEATNDPSSLGSAGPIWAGKPGKLKIFFGACPGVGKTYSMLNAAKTISAQGIKVLAGVVESHGRADTLAQIEGLNVLSPKEVLYESKTFYEFDLDAVLEQRPDLVLVDELAHSNVPGSRHAKRWQDVEEILAAGIDVYSTLNVQHLESMADVVGRLANLKIRETIPDRILDRADEVVLVDLGPEELLARMRQGKVYAGAQAARAQEFFFRKGTLLALRELSLRKTANRVLRDMDSEGHSQRTHPVLMACIGVKNGAEVIALTHRLATQMRSEWHAVYVETPTLQRLSREERAQILEQLRKAKELGAQTTVLSEADPVMAMIQYARRLRVTLAVVGRPESVLPWGDRFVQKLSRSASGLDVVQCHGESGSDGKSKSKKRFSFSAVRPKRINQSPYLKSLAITAICGLVAFVLDFWFDQANLVMLFLVGVALCGSLFGRGPAIMAAVLNVLIFDFFFVAPRGSFSVNDIQYLFTFTLMLGVGVWFAQLTSGLRFQARVAQKREERFRILFEASGELAACISVDQLPLVIQKQLPKLYLEDFAIGSVKDGLLQWMDMRTLPHNQLMIADWVCSNKQAAGIGTDTLSESDLLLLPLVVATRCRGVLAVVPQRRSTLLQPESRRFLDAFATLVAQSMERLHYEEVARNTVAKVETEQLRNTMLTLLSHDLKTPLAAVSILAEQIRVAEDADPKQRDLARNLTLSVNRLHHLTDNVLEMVRLESTMPRLQMEWQDLNEIIGLTLENFDPIKIGELALDLDPKIDLVWGDALLLQRLLNNLIDNALKHGAIPLYLKSRIQGDWFHFEFSDSGPGIPKGQEQVIFKKFQRVEADSQVPGSGLGLALCKTIVELHRGRLGVRNLTEGGACFWFDLPSKAVPQMSEEL